MSANGKDYREVERIENEINKDDESKILDIKIDMPDEERIRYVKILLKNVGTCPAWHKGAGGPACLESSHRPFLDRLSDLADTLFIGLKKRRFFMILDDGSFGNA